MKDLKNYRVYNNLIFLIPVISGIYIHVFLFTLLAVLILIGSTTYHASLVKESAHSKKTRIFDVFIALACYTYLFYYITYHKETFLQPFLYISLAVTLIIFAIGKYRRSDFIHALFHTSIAVVASAIALF